VGGTNINLTDRREERWRPKGRMSDAAAAVAADAEASAYRS